MIDQIMDFNRQFVVDKSYERYLTDKYPDKNSATMSTPTSVSSNTISK